MISRYIFHSLLVGILSILISSIGWSSTSWKQGYFINNTGDTTYCLIKDEDWKNNPEQFKWRSSLNSQPRIASIEFVSRFMIDSTAFFVRDTIQFETSSSKMEQLSTTREPEFESRTTFLKVLVQGKASLYYYEKGDAQRFFYSSPNQPQPEPLIYKMYKNEDEEIRKNIKYREQVWRGFDCTNLTLKRINSVAYEQNDLTDLFVEINKCLESQFINYGQYKSKGIIRISPFISVYNMHSDLTNSVFINSAFITTTSTTSSASWQTGIEFEYSLPFWNNSWSVCLAPSLIQSKSGFSYTLNDTLRNSVFNFLAIDINIAAKKYISLSHNNTMYILGGFVFSSPIRSNFSATYVSSVVPPSTNFILGLGYRITELLNIELRFGFQRNYKYYYVWDIDSNYYGVLLSTTLFEYNLK